MVVLIGVAMLTVVLSWTVLNMVSTLRYADQHRGSGRAGIDVGDSNAEEPPRTATSPTSPSQSACVTRCPTPGRGIGRFAARRSPKPCSYISAGRSSVARSISLRPDSLIIDLFGAQGCAYSSTEAASSRM
jgi:hypothetical protein